TPTPIPTTFPITHPDYDTNRNMCGVVATMVYGELSSAYWREIIAVDGVFPDGRKFKHMACVWIPMEDAKVLMYDVQYGTFELPTKDNSKEAILTALRVSFAKLTLIDIHFLDEK